MHNQMVRANNLFSGNFSETIQAVTYGDNHVVVRMRVLAQGHQRDATGFATFQTSDEIGNATDIAHENAFRKALDSFEFASSAPAEQPPAPARAGVATYQEANPSLPSAPMPGQVQEVKQVLCHCQRAMRGTDRNGNLFPECPKCHAERKYANQGYVR